MSTVDGLQRRRPSRARQARRPPFLLPLFLRTIATLCLLRNPCPACALSDSVSASASASASSASSADLDALDGNWYSVTPSLQVQWGKPKNPQHARRLEHIQQRMLGFGGSSKGNVQTGMSSPYLNGNEIYYDDYSQAWRMLGFYMDCNDNMAYVNNNDNDNNRRRRTEALERRKLKDDGEQSCQRYLLWAAYVDLDHEGDGLYEYIMWDPKNDRWNYDGCRYDPSEFDDDAVRARYEKNYRCVKMDCHVPMKTHFELLGVFKEPGHDEWFEQLFKHEGNCVWTEDEYNFMQTYREVWPDECTALAGNGNNNNNNNGGGGGGGEGGTDENGNPLYYHIKPVEGGLMDIGLYTDAYCSVDYTGKYDRDTLLSGLLVAEYEYGGDDDGGNNNGNNNGNNQLDLLDNIDKWNELLSIYTLCQPCVAYTPAWMNSYQENNGDNRRRRASSDDGFECDDDAGYNNVNQCMKFATHTDMMVAYNYDIMTASRQGGLTTLPVEVTSMSAAHKKQPREIPMTFWYALAYFVSATLLYLKAVQVRSRVRRQKALKQPLMDNTRNKRRKRRKDASSDNGVFT